MKRIATIGLMSVVVLLLARCTFLQTPEEADRDAIRDMIAGDTVWFNGSTTVDSTGGGSYIDGDTVFIWWRGKQTHSQPDVHIEVTGDSAWVEWSRKNFGELYTMAKPPDTTWQLWTKKLVETAVVRAVFTRGSGGMTEPSGNRGWELSHVSLARGQSDSSNAVRIDSLRIQSSSNEEILIEDPLNTYFSTSNLVGFDPGEVVTLTLYTNSEETEAYLHTFVLHWPFYVRLKFNALGGGVYRGVWPAQAIPFPRFAIFDLLDRGTIRTPIGAYDFSGWLFPYYIREP